MQKDLKLIKAKFGEEMSNFCRDNFSTILEKEGVLSTLLLNCFHPNKELLMDIKKEKQEQDFIRYINSKTLTKKNIALTQTTKTPFELMEEAGYDLYHCKTEKDVQKFKKYYQSNETLCTFRDNRTENYLVFFAVKKNVDEIKREDFKTPQRQDDYGTSVISIQFHKLLNKTTLSIKNRYNHTVDNSDATFSNNLENIIEGLTYSFNKTYDVDAVYLDEVDFELNDYVKVETICEGSYCMFKMNCEVDGVYYCQDNIIIHNGTIIQLPKEQQILIGNHILDLQSKEVFRFTRMMDTNFGNSINNSINNSVSKGIDQDKEITLRELIIQPNGKYIKINFNKNNRIISIDNIENIENSKVIYDKDTNNKIVKKTVTITQPFTNKKYTLVFDGNNNLMSSSYLDNDVIKSWISIPLTSFHKDYFALSFEKIENIEITKTNNMKVLRFQKENEEDIIIKTDKDGNIIEYYNLNIKELNDCFLQDNISIKVFKTPNVTTIGACVLEKNEEMREIDISKAESISHHFMNRNNTLTSLNLEAIKDISSFCFEENTVLKYLNMPNVTRIDHDTLTKTKFKEKVLEYSTVKK